MTLLEALKQSRAMWLWLYENLGKSKTDYLNYKYAEYPHIKHLCFICHHHIKGEYCQGYCPIKWLSSELSNTPYACEYFSSPYYKWISADEGSEEEHEAAGKIIDLHDEAIKRCKDV